MIELHEDLPAHSLIDRLPERASSVDTKIVEKKFLDPMFGLVCHKYAVRDRPILECLAIEHFCQLLLINIVLGLNGFNKENYGVGLFFADLFKDRLAKHHAEVAAYR